MTARQSTYEIMHRFSNRGINLSFDTVNTLRRAQIALHRWSEQECGDGDNYKSWAIERDETTGKPSMVIYPHDGKQRSYRIPDRETGALKRIEAICKFYGLHFYYQTDPRGCSLYVDNKPIADNAYNNAVAVVA